MTDYHKKKGMFKIGSRECWTINGRTIYFVSLPELFGIRVKGLLIMLLRAVGFYAAKCGCRDRHGERPLKFRLNRCKNCIITITLTSFQA